MSNIITCQDWTEGADYKYAWAPTNDPRVVVVIRTDEYVTFEQELDGDAILPTYMVDRDTVSHSGGYEGDSAAIAQRIVEAQDQFRYAAGYRYDGLRADVMVKAQRMLERWAWIFHGTVFHRGGYGYGNEYDIITMSTPEFREHVGQVGEYAATREQLQSEVEGMRSEIANIADGYVYGIGYAVTEERVLDDEPIDIEDGDWTETVEVWGYVGEEYAQQSAAAFEAGSPDLPEMLTLPTLTEV